MLSTNAALVADVRRRTNFGFHGSREAPVLALNAKLSEYHAAVGLASLDDWPRPAKTGFWPASAYREMLGAAETVRLQPGFGETWVSSVCVIELPNGGAAALGAKLGAAGIETRNWWGGGARTHASMAAAPRSALPVTERLAATTLVLPLSRDIQDADIRRVSEVILERW